ncbi:MAG TPA: fumarylacetoacetate hydrolase family protein [Pelomicrobium sp.]|nr:fumarylacetoacetate hydrolase family protein [Pelomicrobium sp.]
MPDVKALAREMKAAQDEVRQIEPFTARIPGFDVPTAYEVAHAIHKARMAEGANPVGRKIGFTNPDMWAQYGVREPAWAYVYDRTLVHIVAEGATCRIGRFTEPKIEPEIVLHFGAAPRAGADLTEILACVDWIAHGFEVVQCHFPGWKFQVADVVADWVLHAILLVGEPVPVARLGPDPIAALENFTLTLSCDREEREAGKGSNVLGSPLKAIAHLLDVLAQQPQYEPLQAGELVTTGTVTTAHAIRPGETWRSKLEDIALPGLSVTFVD